MEELRNTEPAAEINAGAQPENITEPAKPKKTFKDFMNGIELKLTRKTVWGLILQIFLILIVIPEAFLMLTGLIFDKWLKLYELTTAIFIVWVIIIIIAIFLTVKSIICYSRSKKAANR